MKILIGVIVFWLAVACIPGDITVHGPVCRTPVPMFRVDSSFAADSVPLGCPFAYVDTTGDTVMVVPVR